MLIPDVQVVFVCNGQRKVLDYRAVPFSAWREVKTVGFTPVSLGEAIGDFDVEAFAALIYLERKQRERKLTWQQFVRELDDRVPDVDMDAEFDVIVDGVSQVSGEKVDDPEDPTSRSSS